MHNMKPYGGVRIWNDKSNHNIRCQKAAILTFGQNSRFGAYTEVSKMFELMPSELTCTKMVQLLNTEGTLL